MNIDQEFIDQLLQYKHIIYKVCLMYAQNQHDVVDLYQETIYNLWKSYKSFKGRSSFGTWVYRISLNTCITDLRKKRNYHFVPLDLSIDVLEDCEKDELLKDMYALIRKLNKEEKMYIMLWLEEKSYDEIAEIIGTNRNQVAVKLHRIKEKLKNMSDI